MEDVFEYQIKEIAKFFLDNGYTEEEQDTFLELAYKQAFDLRDIRSLNYNIKQTKDLNIPFEKYPKEMHIYSVRLNYIENYIRRMSEPNINIVIDNESYSFAIENNKTTAIKALSYSKNYNLLNKILFDIRNNTPFASLIKDTDYIIIYRIGLIDTPTKIYKIYDKEKEITDEKKIKEILKLVTNKKMEVA